MKKIKNLIFASLTLVLSTSVVATAAAFKLSVEQEQVICKLKDTVNQQKQAGQNLVFLPLLGKIREKVEAPFTLKMDANAEYTIIGVCNDNCQNLQLTLNNAKGEKVATQSKDNAVPTIKFTPTESKDFILRAKPEKCVGGSCEFGMVMFTPKNTKVDTASRLPEDIYLFKFCPVK
jgi:hypothetical protein